MRITGGKYLNRKIKCPKGVIRPAMDRMRESMFSILGSMEGCSFLDIFSGSGLVGIEAASRGASPVVLVEKDPGKKQTILENMAFVEEDIRLMLTPAEKFILLCRDNFYYIYLDPPFSYKFKKQLIEAVADAGILDKNGSLIMHHPKSDELPEKIKNLALRDRRKYGESTLSFYSFSSSS